MKFQICLVVVLVALCAAKSPKKGEQRKRVESEPEGQKDGGKGVQKPAGYHYEELLEIEEEVDFDVGCFEDIAECLFSEVDEEERPGKPEKPEGGRGKGEGEGEKKEGEKKEREGGELPLKRRRRSIPWRRELVGGGEAKSGEGEKKEGSEAKSGEGEKKEGYEWEHEKGERGDNVFRRLSKCICGRRNGPKPEPKGEGKDGSGKPSKEVRTIIEAIRMAKRMLLK